MATSKPTGKVTSNLDTLGYRHKETLPTKLSVADVISLSRALPMTTMSPNQLLDRMLVEGRGDAGVNEYNTNNPRAVAEYNKATAAGHDNLAATFLAAVLDKSETAKRVGRSFDEVWNGTGRSATTGKTGADYAARMKTMEGASKDPRNAGVLDLVTRASKGELSKVETLAAMPPRDVAAMALGNFAGNLPLTDEASPMATLINRKYLADTGKTAEENGVHLEGEAALVLSSHIKKAAGVELGHSDLLRLKSHENNPATEKIFSELAKDSLPLFGIKGE